MVQRNPHLAKLQSGYLFPEINRRKQELLDREPNAQVISLGIGDTTEPLGPYTAKALSESALRLGTPEGYSGYGPEQGMPKLRERIADVFYGGRIDSSEVYVSDGAKCDVGRLQILFGSQCRCAVQDPSYPVYVDSGVIMGQTDGWDEESSRFSGIEYLPCVAENGFFPDLPKERVDLIYFCSPNNPTGAVATREQLELLVRYAKENRSIVIFDAAYAAFIQDKSLPRSIFEIDGAREVAIEVNSLSKPAGFTGVRLGWTVVPADLSFDDGSSVAADWSRIVTTLFNGASNIVQRGAHSALDNAGLDEMYGNVSFYLENAALIRRALESLGYQCFGGKDSPYIWACFEGEKSWDAFERLLNSAHIVTTPGAGFGPSGEGFLRFSAFGHRADVIEACERLARSA